MRNYLKEGTWIRLPGGECYQITGTPISISSTGLIYPATRLLHLPDGSYKTRELKFAIKECFPVSSEYDFLRSDSGEIIPASDTPESRYYLAAIQQMQLNEIDTIATIYNAGGRLVPILSAAAGVDLSFDEGKSFHYIDNIFTVMESLTAKGNVLSSYLQNEEKLSVHLAFRITEQVLYAVREIHAAGFLHLDIQSSNIFIKGSLSAGKDFASIIDLGSSRQITEDGKCDVIADKAVISTQGFSAPEISHKNDGTLQLGPEADLYSIGYLLLLLLTGKCYQTEDLYSENEEHSLTDLPFSHIHCPEELAENVKQILAKALAYEPSDRYHSCDEMLYDIYEMLKALQPHTQDMPLAASAGCDSSLENSSETGYDAFISYKQNTANKTIAETLQEQLKHFTAPRFWGIKQKKINRIFIDQGELSSCSDFGLQIRECLKKAEWLIVLCSPETKDSQWVNLEIKAFLDYHDYSHILAVVTDGEPDKVFPDALFARNNGRNEFLTVDIRGRNLDEVLKNATEKELSKIAAPLLGISYDSLKQKKRTFLLQRTAIAACTAFVILSAFTAYSLVQKNQLNEKYELAMQNQAHYLSDLSLDIYASGDKETALLTVLAATPENAGETPFVGEQAYTLNTILSPYKSDAYKDYSPEYSSAIDRISTCALSSDGSYVLALDTLGTVHFLTSDTGESIWSVDPTDFDAETFTYALPASETTAYLISSQKIYLADLNTKTITSTVETTHSLPQEDFQYSACGNLLAVHDGNLIYIYDFEKGELTATADLTEVMDEEESSLNAIVFQESGKQLAIGLSDKTVLYSLKQDTFTLISNSAARAVRFTDDTHLAVIHSKSIESSDALSCFLSIYDLEEDSDMDSSDNDKGKTASYKSSSFTVSSPSYTGLELSTPLEDSEESSQLFCWFQNQLLIVDLENMETLGKTVFESTIDHAFSYNRSRCLVGFNDGTVKLLRFTYGFSKYDALALTTSVDSVFYNTNADTLIQLHDGRLTYSTSGKNPDMENLLAADLFEAEYSFENVAYFSTASANYRCVEMSHDSAYNVSALIVYDVASNEPIFQYQGDAEGMIYNITIDENDGSSYLHFTEITSEDKTTSYKMNLTSGESLVKENQASDKSSEENSQKTVYGQTVFAVQNETFGIDIYDCETEELTRSITLENSSCDDFAFYNNDTSLIVLSNQEIVLYDLVTGKVTMKYPLEQEISFGTLITGTTSNYFALKDSSDDEQSKQPLYIFSVDEEQEISLFAKVDHGNIDLNTMQIYIYSGDVLSYVNLYDYEELTEMARDVVGDRTLSEEEKVKYYISE